MNHSPGPWIDIIDSPKARNPMALVATSHKGSASRAIDCTNSGKSYAVDCANAKLVAAAPDLLQAAQAVAEYINGRQPVQGWLVDTDASRTALSGLLAAIDKATK
jgi:hypothetical protein